MPSRWDAATHGWSRRVFHYPLPTLMSRNFRLPCTIELQPLSLTPLKMRKVEFGGLGQSCLLGRSAGWNGRRWTQARQRGKLRRKRYRAGPCSAKPGRRCTPWLFVAGSVPAAEVSHPCGFLSNSTRYVVEALGLRLDQRHAPGQITTRRGTPGPLSLSSLVRSGTGS